MSTRITCHDVDDEVLLKSSGTLVIHIMALLSYTITDAYRASFYTVSNFRGGLLADHFTPGVDGVSMLRYLSIKV